MENYISTDTAFEFVNKQVKLVPWNHYTGISKFSVILQGHQRDSMLGSFIALKLEIDQEILPHQLFLQNLLFKIAYGRQHHFNLVSGVH